MIEMRRIFPFLFLLLFIFGGSFLLSQNVDVDFLNKKSALPFAPAYFTLKNRPFTIIMVGYNNGAYVERALQSVFALNYDNFRLVYIDDASDDGSFEVAKDFICDSDHVTHVTLVRNDEHLGTLANVYRAVIGCPDDEIIVLLNGEDWFAHEWVLQRLNAHYEDANLWITLAQGIDYPSYHLAEKPHVKEARKINEWGSHLKSFYAALFKKVREEDFIYATKFLPECADLSLMSPMCEMADGHFRFIPEVLTVNNREAIKIKDSELIAKYESVIRSIQPYSPLITLRDLPCGD